ncbi:hypothetical protein E2C01_091602 [Portunus trituberculatus]|uniref:Uncharacterized protein n=1 Tax=Portunus trituberculatus TaxID=210409 RepID=A0A5B7JP14_PORTR|nr:hypothetical protein [Portunus trituberculatus]
MKGMSLTQP